LQKGDEKRGLAFAEPWLLVIGRTAHTIFKGDLSLFSIGLGAGFVRVAS